MRREHHPNYRFSTANRLKRTEDFQRIYSLNQRVSDAHLLVFASRNTQRITRCGLSVSKKHGNAVHRNRIKRLLREAFRLTCNQLPVGLDLILIPRIHSGAGLEEYKKSLPALARRIVRRWDRTTSKRPPSSGPKQTDLPSER